MIGEHRALSVHPQFTIAGLAFWSAVLGGAAGIPGPGPLTAAAEFWAPFARAAMLLGAPLGLIALAGIGLDIARRRSGPSVGESGAAVAVLLLGLLFWWMLETGGVRGATSVGAADRIFLSIPPSLVRIGALLVALLSLTEVPWRLRFSRMLLGAGVALGLIVLPMGGERLGVDLATPLAQRFRGGVMAVILIAAGWIGLRRRTHTRDDR